MAIFRFFKMVTAAILDFRNFKIVMVEKFKRAKLRHCAKFRADRSNRCGGMTIFFIFKMAAAPSWIFKFWKF